MKREYCICGSEHPQGAMRATCPIHGDDEGDGLGPMRTCTCTADDADSGCVDHGDGSTWHSTPSPDESIPDGWLADGSWKP